MHNKGLEGLIFIVLLIKNTRAKMFVTYKRLSVDFNFKCVVMKLRRRCYYLLVNK